MDNKYFCGGPTPLWEIILYNSIKYLPSLLILVSIIIYLVVLKFKNNSYYELNINNKILLITIFMAYSFFVTQIYKLKEIPIFTNTKNRTKTYKDYIKEYIINYQYYLPKILLILIIIGNIILLKYHNDDNKMLIFINISIIGVYFSIMLNSLINSNMDTFDLKKIIKINGPHIISLILLFFILYLNLNNNKVAIGLILIIIFLDFSYVIEGSLENQN